MPRTTRTTARVKVLPPGALGAASIFCDGVNDKVDCGLDASLAFAGPFTLIGWCLVHGVPVNLDAVVGRIPGSGAAGYGCHYTAAAKKWDFWAKQYNVNYARVTLPDARWFPLACVYDGANVIAYVDGVKTVGAALTGSPGDAGVSFSLGGVAAWGAWAPVRLTNWRAFARAVTDAEVAAFGRNEAIDATSLVSHWLMEEGAGGTAADSVGPNTGTLAGATWSTDAPYKPRTMRTGARTMRTTARELHP